ncbi:MAG: metal ABC transporter permease [Clostridiales bacterium]|nr:metal ABC transporter permease [Clostridiales bacterium]
MNPQLEIQLIAIFIATACALPGVFLVLRKMTMMSDSISHTTLLGIVLAFFIVHDLSSPFLVVGAAAMGVITVWLTESLHKTKLVSEDSSIGIVFPLLFSIAVILISKYAGSVHLDSDSVLEGDLVSAPFYRLELFGVSIGAKYIYISLFYLILNIVLIAVFFKELKVSAFDPMLASVLGFSPILLHYGLMSLVSITAVGAFEAVGSILVIAFMAGPPVTAYLLTDDLKKMLFISGGMGALNAVLGFQLARFFDVSISGAMAVMTGVTFLIVFIFAPQRGLISIALRRKRQKLSFGMLNLLIHLLSHENSEYETREAEHCSLANHLHWHEGYARKIVDKLIIEKLIVVENGILKLTDTGRTYTSNEYSKIFNN